MLKSVTIIGTVNVPKKSKLTHNLLPTLTPAYEAAHSSGFLSSYHRYILRERNSEYWY